MAHRRRTVQSVSNERYVANGKLVPTRRRKNHVEAAASAVQPERSPPASGSKTVSQRGFVECLAMRKIIAFTVVGAAVLLSVWLISSKVAQSRRNSSLIGRRLPSFSATYLSECPKRTLEIISTRTISNITRPDEAKAG